MAVGDNLAGDVDYGRVGAGYGRRRRADPTIAALIDHALGSAGTVLNVGAGAGSYEPPDRSVIAVEPSPAMLSERSGGGAAVVRAVAAALPFADGSVPASMATVTIHQWPDWRDGVRELRRVTDGPIVVLTIDPAALDSFWLSEYVPELYAAEAVRFPPIDALARALGPDTDVGHVAVPLDCPDGFIEAFYGRPEAFLDPAVHRAQSAWTFVSRQVAERAMGRLGDDLAAGRWDERHGPLRVQSSYQGALRLLVGQTSGR